MKVIIAGSREFNDYLLLKTKCDELIGIYNTPYIEIVHGGCRGADKLGEKYANDKGYKIKEFPADFRTHGKAAGPLRNRQMAQYADMLIAFRLPGESRGTDDMIRQAYKYGLEVHVIKI